MKPGHTTPLSASVSSVPWNVPAPLPNPRSAPVRAKSMNTSLTWTETSMKRSEAGVVPSET